MLFLVTVIVARTITRGSAAVGPVLAAETVVAVVGRALVVGRARLAVVLLLILAAFRAPVAVQRCTVRIGRAAYTAVDRGIAADARGGPRRDVALPALTFRVRMTCLVQLGEVRCFDAYLRVRVAVT